MMKLKRIDILLVDDNEDDVCLTKRALSEVGISENVAVCSDGAEALDFLFGEGAFAARGEAVEPRLMLVDIKLPKIDGLELTRRLRADARTAKIPIVIITSSTRKADLDAAYQAGANSYVTKWVDYNQFLREIEQLGRHWLR